MPQYQELYEVAHNLDNWGIAANIARLRDFNTLEQEATAEIRKWEARLASYGNLAAPARTGWRERGHRIASRTSRTWDLFGSGGNLHDAVGFPPQHVDVLM